MMLKCGARASYEQSFAVPEVLDRLLPIAALSNVELRCCCDSGLVGYRMASPVAVPEVRKLRRWGLKKDKKDGKEGKELLAAPLVPEAGVCRLHWCRFHHE